MSNASLDYLTISLPCKHQQTIGWKEKARGSNEAMQRLGVCENFATVACGDWVHPVLVDVAIKNFSPAARPRETDSVVEAMRRSEVNHDDHIMPLALNPAMKRKHSVFIVSMNNSKTLPSKFRITTRSALWLST